VGGPAPAGRSPDASPNDSKNKGALPPGHPAVSGASGSPESMQAMVAAQHASAGAGPSEAGSIRVSRAEGANGKKIAELYSQKATLNGAEIAVRGKVVKFTPKVMGKNWLHLRDGSGSREKKDDDITVTTTGTAAVGDVVLVRGVVHLDRDLGAGYAYPVIIEDAKLSK
jgi:hypothetical protein